MSEHWFLHDFCLDSLFHSLLQSLFEESMVLSLELSIIHQVPVCPSDLKMFFVAHSRSNPNYFLNRNTQLNTRILHVISQLAVLSPWIRTKPFVCVEEVSLHHATYDSAYWPFALKLHQFSSRSCSVLLLTKCHRSFHRHLLSMKVFHQMWVLCE